MRGRSRVAAVFLVALGALALSGCVVKDEDAEPEAVADPSAHAPSGAGPEVEASAPFAAVEPVPDDRLEAERLDPSWRQYADRDLESRRSWSGPAPGAARPQAIDGENPILRKDQAADEASEGAAAPRAGRRAEPSGSAHAERADPEPAEPGAPERWEDISPEALRTGRPSLPVATDGGGPTVLRLQWLLDRAHFSPGVIDGRWGKNTEKAVYWYQESLGLEPTGRVDRDLYERLARAAGDRTPVRRYAVTAGDVGGPFVDVPDDPEAEAELDCLCYGSTEELLAERFHVTQDLLAQLNPRVDLAGLRPGTEIWVPAVDPFDAAEPGGRSAARAGGEVARIVISKGGFYLQALGADGTVLYHFPTTVGSDYNPSPEGRFAIEGVGWRPDFHYQPELLSSPGEPAASDRDLLLPPGPNSPVGVVWMQLSKDGYGIHGTARPETIGYTTSHGCIRLTNWDAAFLGRLVSPGVAVEFLDGTHAASRSAPAAGATRPGEAGGAGS